MIRRITILVVLLLPTLARAGDHPPPKSTLQANAVAAELARAGLLKPLAKLDYPGLETAKRLFAQGHLDMARNELQLRTYPRTAAELAQVNALLALYPKAQAHIVNWHLQHGRPMEAAGAAQSALEGYGHFGGDRKVDEMGYRKLAYRPTNKTLAEAKFRAGFDKAVRRFLASGGHELGANRPETVYYKLTKANVDHALEHLSAELMESRSGMRLVRAEQQRIRGEQRDRKRQKAQRKRERYQRNRAARLAGK
jgi:hypothetical protein